MRFLDYDASLLNDQKVQLTSVPCSSFRAFSVESAGARDRATKLNLYTRDLSDLEQLAVDFRKGNADIIAIQRFLAAVVLGTPQDATR
ncbi:hypothetical protein ACA910_013370 [Epithemia clementina (nom. ined.)]